MAKKQRKHNYVVGYLGEGDYVFGKVTGRRIRENWTVAQPMTLYQANSMLKDLHCYPKAIFKLVPLMTMNVNKPKKK